MARFRDLHSRPAPLPTRSTISTHVTTIPRAQWTERAARIRHADRMARAATPAAFACGYGWLGTGSKRGVTQTPLGKAVPRRRAAAKAARQARKASR